MKLIDLAARRKRKQLRQEARYKRNCRASGIWFAWRPVLCDDDTIRWLERVRWKNTPTGYGPYNSLYVPWLTHYFPLENDND